MDRSLPPPPPTSALIFSPPPLWSRLTARSKRVPNFLFEGRTANGNTNRYPGAAIAAPVSPEDDDISSPSLALPTSRPLPSLIVWPPTSRFILSAYMHVCLFITGFPWWPCTLQYVGGGGGLLRIRAKDHFLFCGKMNDPVWKGLPLASGQLEFAVSQWPSLLCVRSQALEKRKNTQHSAETNAAQWRWTN